VVDRETNLTVATRRVPVALSGLAALAFGEAAVPVPSCPFALTRTGWATPVSVVPLTPTKNVRLWVPEVPIRIVPDSP
jgi:hypothetical protein